MDNKKQKTSVTPHTPIDKNTPPSVDGRQKKNNGNRVYGDSNNNINPRVRRSLQF